LILNDLAEHARLAGMADTPTPRAALAASAWRRIFDFIVATSPQRIDLLAGHGLTPNDSRALQTLSADRTGRPMRSLAAEWRCDASTATWIVDRLEAKGFAERRPHPTDRRVKLVALTARGVDMQATLVAGTYAPPPQLLAMSDEDLAILLRGVELLPAQRHD
jgi:MarR family transcriptional regulator, organic hydroperoxide resistance regulator